MSRRTAIPAGMRDLAEVVAVYQTEAADAAAFHARVAAASAAADTAACDEALARCDTRAAWLTEVVDGAGLKPPRAEGEGGGGGPATARLAAALAAVAAPDPSPPPAVAAAAAAEERTAAFAAIMRDLQAARTPEDLAAVDAAYEAMRGGGGGAAPAAGRGGRGAAAAAPPPAPRPVPVRGPPLGPGLWPVTSLPGGAPPPPAGPAAEL